MNRNHVRKRLRSFLALFLAAITYGELTHAQVSNRVDYPGVGPSIALTLADVTLDGEPIRPNGAEPSNDDLANAIDIPSSLLTPMVGTGSTVSATRQEGEPSHSGGWLEEGGSVWYTWTSPWSGSVYFDVEGSSPGVFAVVYRGNELTNLVPIGNSYTHEFLAMKGERYLIAAANLGGDFGPVILRITPPPLNDDIANAFEMLGDHGTYQGNTRSATYEAGEIPATASIWWKWTASEDGEFFFLTADTTEVDVISTVYAGTNLLNLDMVMPLWPTSSKHQPWEFGRWAGSPFPVKKSMTYYFRLSGGDPFHSQPGTIILRYAFKRPGASPPNDYFANRPTLSALTNRIRADNILAGYEPFEAFGVPPLCQAGRSLWWRYVAPTRGRLFIGADWDGHHMLVDVFKGDSEDSLIRIASKCLEPVFVDAEQGEAFEIKIDQLYYYETPGPFNVSMDFVPTPLNDRFDSSQVMTDDHWETHGHTYTASIEPGEPMPPGVTNGQTVWYTWVPSFSGLVTLDIKYLGQYGIVSVFTGSRVDSLQPVRFPERYWMREGIFLAKEGVPYHIRIASQGAGEFDLSLNHSPFGIAPSDGFTSAIPLVGVQDVSVRGATLEQGEPKHFGWPREKSVWLKWDSLQQGKLTLKADENISLCPEFGMAVYLGDRVDSLQLLAKDRHVLTVPIEPERTYYVAVAAPEDCDGGAVFWAEWKPRWDLVPNSLNLLCDGDFETGQFVNREGCWHVDGDFTGVFKDYGGLSGNNHALDKSTWPILLPGAKLWQEFSTTQGLRCELRFGFSGAETDLRVLLDDQEVGIFHVNMAPPGWLELIRPMVASNATSRLTFECLKGGAHVDAVSVVRLDQPPEFVEPLASVSIPLGGTVVFQPRIKGSSPLSFQWFHEDAALVGQTNRLLSIDAAAAAHEGNYTLRITNAYGFAAGGPAHLTVEMPTALSLVLQPQSFTATAGAYASLSALAVGTPPIRYQWYGNSGPLIGETNRQLVFSEIKLADAGRYTVEASNGSSTVLSLPATVCVIESPFAGGRVSFQNRFLNGGGMREIPVFDVDGTTPLSGVEFAAQLYAGPSVGELQAVGSPASFGTGALSGIFRGAALTVPNVAPGAIAVLQVRAWQAQMGASYEEARALGGKFGRSTTFELALGQPLQIAPPLLGLTSFSLQAGLPRLNVGVIRLVNASEGAESTWALMGEKGFRYLIERSGSDFVWRPWLVLTNSSGEVIFRDMDPKENNGTRFYRSRILD